MQVLFLGPRLLAGIGQVTNRYAELLRSQGHDTEYCEVGHPPKKQKYDAKYKIYGSGFCTKQSPNKGEKFNREEIWSLTFE